MNALRIPNELHETFIYWKHNWLSTLAARESEGPDAATVNLPLPLPGCSGLMAHICYFFLIRIIFQ